MKKPYVKPQVYFEDFQLSASIAGNCKLIIINLTGNTCPVEDRELGAIYYANKDICGEDYTAAPGDIKICYDTNSVPDNQVFASL